MLSYLNETFMFGIIFVTLFCTIDTLTKNDPLVLVRVTKRKKATAFAVAFF